MEVIPTILSICLYDTEEVEDALDLTLTLIVDVSMKELSRINLWLNKDELTVKACDTRVPSYTSIFSNLAKPLTTGTVIFSGMENM